MEHSSTFYVEYAAVSLWSLIGLIGLGRYSYRLQHKLLIWLTKAGDKQTGLFNVYMYMYAHMKTTVRN